MTNIIARLRQDHPLSWEDRLEAADEITRLRDETDEWEKSHNTLVKEIERLREENARLIRENKVAFEAVGGVVKANDKLKEENARLKEEIERQRKRVNIWVNRAHELGHGESFD